MNTTIEKEIFDIIGDNHQMTSAETPLRPDAFVKSDAKKTLVRTSVIRAPSSVKHLIDKNAMSQWRY